MSVLDLGHVPLFLVDAWLPTLERIRKDRLDEDRREREGAQRG